jgi:hypothetical protein
MTEVRRIIGTTPHAIFQVLSDGWSYAAWVVGAAHIRDVDPQWPHVDTAVHHRIGPWPVSVDDRTVVREMVPDQLLELDARTWPMGAARVRMSLDPLDEGRTEVLMAEWLTSPLGQRVPQVVQDAILVPRNREALARLDDIAVHKFS